MYLIDSILQNINRFHDILVYRNEKEIMINKFAGHMLRTKLSSANEGGVAAGFGALDSVFLFD